MSSIFLGGVLTDMRGGSILNSVGYTLTMNYESQKPSNNRDFGERL